MKLANSDILKLLPEHISGDPRFSAAGKAVNPVLRKLDLSIPNLLIYARLEGENSHAGQTASSFLPPLRRLAEARGGLAPLCTEALEALAWQFHVDFRETATTDERLAAMILASIPWHRIKGTPASIKKALALFGYAGIEIEEHAPDMPWACYQLGLSEITELTDLARIQAIAREMQPTRCRLWRVYNDAWDQRPGIFDYGNPDRYGWDNFWWDLYSGAEMPDESGGLIVSFGQTLRLQSKPWQNLRAAFGQRQTTAALIRYLDHFIWDAAAWDDLFVRNHGFVVGEVVSLQVGELRFGGDSWQNGQWSVNPWGQNFHYDRALPDFEIFWHSQPKSQLVHDDTSDKPESWQGPDDLNSCHDVPFVRISEAPPEWDAHFWDEDSRQTRLCPVLEQVCASLSVPVKKLDSACDSGFMPSCLLASGSGNPPLAASPEVSGQGDLACSAGDPLWQSGVWTDDLWRDCEWGKTVSVKRPLAKTSFLVTEYQGDII